MSITSIIAGYLLVGFVIFLRELEEAISNNINPFQLLLICLLAWPYKFIHLLKTLKKK